MTRSRVRFSPPAHLFLKIDIKNIKYLIMKKEVLVKMQCSDCKNINYYTSRNKKTIKEKLELKKHCSKCKKHTLHKEMKK